MGKGIFITGTGTDVGKTYVTALIVKKLKDAGYNASYYKAALSGAINVDNKLVAGDLEYVKKIARLENLTQKNVSFIYENAVSPHLAAKLENKQIEMDVIKEDYNDILSTCDFLTVEGSGGIVCPLRYDNEKVIMLEDVVKELNLNVLNVGMRAMLT